MMTMPARRIFHVLSCRKHRKAFTRLMVMALLGLAMCGASRADDVLTSGNGQTLAAFRLAAKAELWARGDRVGFTLLPCELDPPFNNGREVYLSRAFSKNKNASSTAPLQIALISVENGLVTAWQEFALPTFSRWSSRYIVSCRENYLEFKENGKLDLQFNWNGTAFSPVPHRADRQSEPGPDRSY